MANKASTKKLGAATEKLSSKSGELRGQRVEVLVRPGSTHPESGGNAGKA